MLVRFLGVAALLYVVFLGTYLLLPGLRSGAEQIYSAKRSYVRHNKLFRDDATCRVLICGTSKILSGFQPLYFDRLAVTNVSSFNLGLPGSDSFIWEPEVQSSFPREPFWYLYGLLHSASWRGGGH